MRLLHRNLRDTLAHLTKLDEDATIYAAEPWTCDSIAIVALEPDDGCLPKKATKLNLVYFLEVAGAREFVEGWEASLPQPANPDERCQRLIQYALNDA